MITDAQTALLDKVSPTGTGTTYSNSYDTGAATAADIGRGRVVRAKVTTDVTFTSGGAGTLQVNFVQSPNPDLSSPTVLATGPVNALAGLTAGQSLWDIPVPDNTQRYVGFQVVVGTAAMTAGTVSAQLVLDTNSASLYPAATYL